MNQPELPKMPSLTRSHLAAEKVLLAADVVALAEDALEAENLKLARRMKQDRLERLVVKHPVTLQEYEFKVGQAVTRRKK